MEPKNTFKQNRRDFLKRATAGAGIGILGAAALTTKNATAAERVRAGAWGGVSTEELMELALKMVGYDKIPEDSGIHIPGTNIRRILFTLDLNCGVLVFAKERGYDCVLVHHPCSTLLEQGKVFAKMIPIAVSLGMPKKVAEEGMLAVIERRMEGIRIGRVRSLWFEAANTTLLEPHVARDLGLALLNIHNPCDEAGRRIGQVKLDETVKRNPNATAGDLVKALSELPESKIAAEQYGLPVELALGQPNARGGPAAFVHAAYISPPAEIVETYWRNGFRTVVTLMTTLPDMDRLRKYKNGANLITTGHYAGDSYGFTPLIKILRDRGLTVDCVGGIIDTVRGT